MSLDFEKAHRLNSASENSNFALILAVNPTQNPGYGFFIPLNGKAAPYQLPGMSHKKNPLLKRWPSMPDLRTAWPGRRGLHLPWPASTLV
jgi:hypothetical protein